jgi:SAM-dependent methyltransferase
MDDASLSSADRERSYSSRTIEAIELAMRDIPHATVQRLLDIGCGYGGLTAYIRDHLHAAEAHGLDIDPQAVAGARERGIVAVECDLRVAALPYEACTFDLVVSLGALNYFATLDGVLREINRVCVDGAYTLVALPNLASWHNRYLLARGYQPRDAEISKEVLAGVHRDYRAQAPVGHVSGITSRAFCELMEHFGFVTLRLIGSSPSSRRGLGLTTAIDRLAARRPTLARRFIYLGRKSGSPASKRFPAGWWQRLRER